VVPAVDIGTCRAKIFKTPHAPDSVGDADLKALDVALAACAAPAYFPSVRIGSRLYADGGLFAVAPDQVALHELEYFVGIVPARVAMLSIGTAAAHYQPSEGLNEGAGAVGWLTDGRLLMTLISVQQQHVQAMMEDRLGERYVHLDAEWPVDGGLGIDVATPEAAKRLKAMARATLSAEVEQQVSGFFDHLGSTSHFAPSPAQDR
jgi:patatin-like phospholipase/acyl hydrolase